MSEGKKNPNYVFNFLESVVSTFAFHRQGNYKENEQLNMESVITYSIKTIKMPPSIWKVLGSISGTPPDTHPNTDPSSTTQHGKQLNQGIVIWFCQAIFLDTNINTARIPSSSLDFNTQGLVAQSSLVLTMPGFPNLSHPNSRSSVCTESVSVSLISMFPFFTLLSQ